MISGLSDFYCFAEADGIVLTLGLGSFAASSVTAGLAAAPSVSSITPSLSPTMPLSTLGVTIGVTVTVGMGEADEVVKLFKYCDYAMIIKDMQGVDRFVKIVV